MRKTLELCLESTAANGPGKAERKIGKQRRMSFGLHSGAPAAAALLLLTAAPAPAGDRGQGFADVTRAVGLRCAMPGEPEFRAREARGREGIALPAGTWDELGAVAHRFGVAPPATRPG